VLCSPGYAQSSWSPQKNVELIAGSAAGGGIDRTARTIQRIWQERKLFAVSSAVVNKPGGSGTIGYTYLSSYAGDAHHLAVSTPTLLTNHIQGTSRLNYTDFTPIALLSSEYLMLSTRADSPLKNAREVLERLRKDPSGLSVAIGSVIGGSNHIGLAVSLKAAGVDIRKLKTVVFKSGTESAIALMGGHVDLAVGAPEQGLPHVQSGKLRVLAIGAPQRLGGAFASTPTWKELGIDVVTNTWRGLVGPRGMTEAQTAFWDQTIARMVTTEDWKKDVEKNLWSDSYLNSGETRKYLDTEYRELKTVLTDLGFTKQ
jgi:putative tricarboxylic transport membrane protein